MTGFCTQAMPNDFRIQVQTTNPHVFEMVQDYIKRCMDWELGYDAARGVPTVHEENDSFPRYNRNARISR